MARARAEQAAPAPGVSEALWAEVQGEQQAARAPCLSQVLSGFHVLSPRPKSYGFGSFGRVSVRYDWRSAHEESARKGVPMSTFINMSIAVLTAAFCNSTDDFGRSGLAELLFATL